LEAAARRSSGVLDEKFEFDALSLYDDVLAATLDTDTFSSAHATTIELMTPEPTTIPMMIWMHPSRC